MKNMGSGRFFCICLIVFLLSACSEASDDTASSVNATKEGEVTKERELVKGGEFIEGADNKNMAAAPSTPKKNTSMTGVEFKTIEWIDLMPKEDLDALMNPPSYVTEVPDGSVEDQISNKIQNTIAAASDDRYQQALVSTRVKSELNGKAVRIPGFVVPLEFNDDESITQFFLVPFFGACIHVPPPPPNQILFVDYAKGLKSHAIHEPIWVSGTLKTSLTNNDMATSAYSLDLLHYEPYTEY